MAFVQTAHSLVPASPAGRNLMSVSNERYKRPVVPITAAMVAHQNVHAAKPRYDSMTDWHGGDTGNDIDVSDATQAIAGQNGGINPDYEPRHQEEKGADMVPPRTLLTDLGKDYWALPGMTGREGAIEPHEPYPSVNTAEVPAAFRRADYVTPGGP